MGSFDKKNSFYPHSSYPHSLMGILAPQTGTAFILKQDETLKIVDIEGGQVCDLFCFSAIDPGEWLSSGRSIDYNDTISLSTGHLLYSNRSSPMLEIVSDTCGKHDFLLPPCSLEMFRKVSGSTHYHPSCHENLVQHFREFGPDGDRIGTTFNVFMNVSVASEGRIRILPPISKAGDHITFKAQMDLIMGLTACAHEETNKGRCKSIGYEILDPI